MFVRVVHLMYLPLGYDRVYVLSCNFTPQLREYSPTYMRCTESFLDHLLNVLPKK